MRNFGMIWPICNIVQEYTEEERNYIDAQRRVCGDDHADIIDILFNICYLSRAKNVVEIGVGHSTTPLLLACKRNGGKLFSTDIGTNHHTIIKDCSNWTYRLGIDSVKMGNLWDGGPIDFIYLDTSHEYLHTTREIDTWEPHLRVGGWIVFHDVTIGIGTVSRAINELISRRPEDFEYHYYPIHYGFGILIKRK